MQSEATTSFAKRYKQLELIGKGGMGRVYKVYDTLRAKRMALKELSREYVESPTAWLKFKNEFRMMTEFRHPNIVEVSEFGMSSENIPYIVMEFVDGKSLSEFSLLPLEQAIETLVQLCHVLSVIHSRLYVHRDLKPDNIKLLDDGSIKLLDYGLMSQLGLPAPTKISGTVYYLAPETLVGGILNESSDLYSLGIIAYELLTGERPFSGTRKEILQGHLKHTPSEPKTLRPEISASLNRIVMTLLEKDRELRYRNCAALLEDLHYLTGRAATLKLPEHKAGYLYSSKLIGRTQEIALCTKQLQALHNGQSHSIFIGAPAGMGKTRLLQELKIFAELDELRSISLVSQFSEYETFAEIKTFIRHLKPLLSESTLQGHPSLIDWASGETNYEGGIDESTLVDALVAWLKEVTQEKPIVVILDDVQWMDVQSVQVFNALIRQMLHFRVYFIFGFRNDELEKTSAMWHTRDEGLSEYLELKPLSEEQTRHVIENLLYPSAASDEFTACCFKNCGGNVFDLIEFLRYLITENYLTRSGDSWLEPVHLEQLSLPETLNARLLLRLKGLSPEAHALADIASVLGEPLHLEVWQALSRYAEESFFQAIDELLSNQIIIIGEEQYHFAHARIRTALYDSLRSEQRKFLHLQIGEFLESLQIGALSEMTSAIATHFVIGKNAPRAIEFSLKAAEEAEQDGAEWRAFAHYRDAVHFLETSMDYPNQEERLLEIYGKAAQFSSAVWIDASTCLQWLQKAIARHSEKQDIETVFALSLPYMITSSIAGDYKAARLKVDDIITLCRVEENTLSWAIMYGAAVCLVDWYQGHQQDCFRHAVAAIEIFEGQKGEFAPGAWPSYSWALFWREKARAYLGQPVVMENVEKIRQLMLDGKSDQTIYWHTLTAVSARAAFTGRWDDLLLWKHRASDLSREMGKIYWFECWISHSYLYGALHHGEFSQLEDHIYKVQASPDPYQQRLAYLFKGVLTLYQQNFSEAEKSLQFFLQEEEAAGPDNSYLEGFVYLGKCYLALDKFEEGRECLARGTELASDGVYENPLYQLQFLRLQAELALLEQRYDGAEHDLKRSLDLAKQLDIPLQQGFIQKLWGRLCLAQHRKEDAISRFSQARDIFLSLGNKYQAGMVISLLETCASPQTFEKQSSKAVESQPSGPPKTVVDENGLTQVDIDDSDPVDPGNSRSSSHVETRFEETNLENTEDDTISSG